MNVEQHLIPPGILKEVTGDSLPVDVLRLAWTAFKPSDLYWTYQLYKIECAKGNRISNCGNFYEREERLDIILRARRIMATCVLISLLYPTASWVSSTEEG